MAMKTYYGEAERQSLTTFFMYGTKEKGKSKKAQSDKPSDYKYKVEMDGYDSC